MEIFVSYESESKDIADEIVLHLEKKGRSCWYAPRDVLISYASDIIEAISKCRIFLLLLSGKSSFSKHVLNEIECAYKYYKEDKTIIVPFRIDNQEMSPEMEYYVQRIQYVDATSLPLPTAIQQLQERLDKLLLPANISSMDIQTSHASTSENFDEDKRVTNRYYDTDDNFENKRLKTEAEMLFPIETQIYDKLLKDRTNLTCLIANTMYAPGVMNKLKRKEISNIIGLCYNEKAYMAANYEYESDNVIFYHQDVEEKDFEEKMESYLQERGISGFDLVDITMGFLDWKNPFRVIRIISHFLNPDALIFVRDIDDTVLFAYPDDKRLFRQFFSYYRTDPISGFRQSGRRVYGYLKKIGARTVTLEKSGIDTSMMSFKDVEKMFFSYFGFIPNDFNIALKKDINNKLYREVLKWCDEHYAELEELFLDEDFIFNSGYFIYTAKM